MLKNGFPHQIKVKQEETDPFLQERTKKQSFQLKMREKLK